LCVVIGGCKLKERFIPRIVRLPWICSTTFTVEFGATTEKDVNCSDRGLLIYGLGVRRLQKKSCRIRIRVRTRRRAGAVEDHAVLSREPEAKVGEVRPGGLHRRVVQEIGRAASREWLGCTALRLQDKSDVIHETIIHQVVEGGTSRIARCCELQWAWSLCVLGRPKVFELDRFHRLIHAVATPICCRDNEQPDRNNYDFCVHIAIDRVQTLAVVPSLPTLSADSDARTLEVTWTTHHCSLAHDVPAVDAGLWISGFCI
jgi:hypothetical protein